MWVVKIGGSLYGAACLNSWLVRLADLPEPVVIVPGGGPFADQVRKAQHCWRFDDWHAHAMALLAMEQMGLLLCGLHPRLAPCGGLSTIRSALAEGHVPVWMPSRHVLAQCRMRADWSVTSDSLTLWLARQLTARGVLIVKSAELPHGATTASALQSGGIVDDSFAQSARALACPVRLVHRSYDGPVGEILADDAQGVLRLMPQRRSPARGGTRATTTQGAETSRI